MLAMTFFFALSGSTPLALATVSATPPLPSHRSVLTVPGGRLDADPRGPNCGTGLGQIDELAWAAP